MVLSRGRRGGVRNVLSGAPRPEKRYLEHLGITYASLRRKNGGVGSCSQSLSDLVSRNKEGTSFQSTNSITKKTLKKTLHLYHSLFTAFLLNTTPSHAPHLQARDARGSRCTSTASRVLEACASWAADGSGDRRRGWRRPDRAFVRIMAGSAL